MQLLLQCRLAVAKDQTQRGRQLYVEFISNADSCLVLLKMLWSDMTFRFFLKAFCFRLFTECREMFIKIGSEARNNLERFDLDLLNCLILDREYRYTKSFIRL